MAQWHDAKVVNRVDWNDHLFSLQFSCEEFPKFTAGQFTKIGIVQEDDSVLSRPYSLVNSPDEDYLEVIAVPVQGGSLSPKLHALQIGDSVKIMSPATGFLVLNEVPKSDVLFLMATGTGIGPFLSILESEEVWQTYKNVILIYGVRHLNDLAYHERIKNWETVKSTQFKFVPIVSREKSDNTLYGRIPQLIQSGDIQHHCGFQFEQSVSQVMICGNPDMIKEVISLLQSLGLKKHLRRSPGQISVERYW